MSILSRLSRLINVRGNPRYFVGNVARNEFSTFIRCGHQLTASRSFSNLPALGLNHIEKIQKEIEKVDKSIDFAEAELSRLRSILMKDFDSWSSSELQLYGNIELVRKQMDYYQGEKKVYQEDKRSLRNDLNEIIRRSSSQSYKFVKLSSVSFPFFSPNGEKHLNLLERDDLVRDINRYISKSSRQKYEPFIISTSRGMGKTFFLKMIGSQSLKDELKLPCIQEAISVGRVLSFDFAKDLSEMKSSISVTDDIFSFFQKLMVYFLCHLFQGKQVDGINFEPQEFRNVSSLTGEQGNFDEWKNRCLNLSVESMIDEYIRLTNIAFETKSDVPPIFLLDEVQSLNKTTERPSSYSCDPPKFHSQLSLLLTQLAVKQYPICICTGTDNGNIMNITEMSRIVPIVLSLAPLSKEYSRNWKEMTDQKNMETGLSIQIDENTDKVMQALVQASYKIPRLLLFAHDTWYDYKKNPTQNGVFPLQVFEVKAQRYYFEMFSALGSYSQRELAHIILSCGIRWTVSREQEYVPGTNIQWRELIRAAVVFPDGHNGFIFPFGLIWSAHQDFTRKALVIDFVSSVVKNLDVRNLFLTHDQLSSYGQMVAGVQFEKTLVSALAVRYYILKLDPSISRVTLENLFACRVGAYSNFLVDFSQGIHYPERTAATVSDVNLPPAVIHNMQIPSAHHDIILPTDNGNVAISVKPQMAKPGEVDKQLKIDKSSQEAARLIWFYLGDELNIKLPILNGFSVCNRHAIETLLFWKRLNNKKRRRNKKAE